MPSLIFTDCSVTPAGTNGRAPAATEKLRQLPAPSESTARRSTGCSRTISLASMMPLRSGGADRRMVKLSARKNGSPVEPVGSAMRSFSKLTYGEGSRRTFTLPPTRTSRPRMRVASSSNTPR